jgi:hypothetical protein
MFYLIGWDHRLFYPSLALNSEAVDEASEVQHAFALHAEPISRAQRRRFETGHPRQVVSYRFRDSSAMAQRAEASATCGCNARVSTVLSRCRCSGSRSWKWKEPYAVKVVAAQRGGGTCAITCGKRGADCVRICPHFIQIDLNH